MKRIVLAFLLTGLIAGAVAGIALATAGKDVSSVTLAPASRLDPIKIKVKTGDWEAEIETKGTSELAVSENTVKPGGHFGWHSHPGPSLVIVKSGTSTFYRGDDPDCTPEVHPAGTAYVDPGGVVHIARNEGSVDLVLVVTRLTPSGAMPRIDAPAPGNCPF
jgi:quercetin dioxygenase-like cupin family protein